MVNDDVISMPDTWEYPWYASWDLAFHTVALAMVDVDFAKAQLRADAPRAVPAPERAAAGLRVELQRRQPAGARLGHAARLRDRARAARRGRRRLAEERLPEAARQLHVVGQPQGPDRAQRVRGRLPRPRQHRRVRPQRAAARPAAASSSPTARRGWRSSPSACSASPSSSASHDPVYEDMVLKFAEHFVFIAAAMDRIGDNQRRAVGRGGRLLLRRAAPARRQRASG